MKLRALHLVITACFLVYLGGHAFLDIQKNQHVEERELLHKEILAQYSDSTQHSIRELTQKIQFLETIELGSHGLALCLVLIFGFYVRRAFWEMSDSLQQSLAFKKQQSEQMQMLTRAIHQSPAAIVMTDVETRMEYVNPRFTQLTGYSEADALGQSTNLLKSGKTHPEVYRRLWESLNTQNEWRGELLNRRKNGTLYWENVYISAIYGDDGIVHHYLAIKEDISDRKRAENRERNRRHILEQLTKNVALPRVLESIALSVEQEMEGAWCSVLLLDPTGKYLLHGAAPSLPEAYNQKVNGTPIGATVGSCGAAAYTGQRFIAEDLKIHPNWEKFRKYTAAAGLEACWSEPVKASDGHILGTFAIYHPVACTPTNIDIEIMESSAQLAALAIEYAQTQEHLRKLSHAVEQSSATIIMTDAAGKIEYVNQFFSTVTGYQREEVIGKTPAILRSAYTSDEQIDTMWTTLISGKEWHGELCNQMKDGSLGWDFAHIMPLTNAEGQITHFISIQENITARKQNEAELKELNTQLSNHVSELKQREHEMRLINEMNDHLQACHTQEEAYQLISRAATSLFPAQEGHLSIFVSDSKQLEVVARWNGENNTPLLFEGEQCWALRTGQPYEVSASGQHLPCQHYHHPHDYSTLCLPLMVQGEILGLFYLGAPSGVILEAKIHQLASSVVETIKLALSNLRLREALREQAIRDRLTGVFNRRYLDEILPKYTHRARLENRPLTVAMLDLDHFKSLNDTYGHEAGDEVLRAFGQCLLTHFPKSIISCRYGGEEFSVLMPETTHQEAYTMLDAFRHALSQIAFKMEEKLLPPITVSIGLHQVHPQETERQALNAADEAVYRAKQNGRNRVERA